VRIYIGASSPAIQARQSVLILSHLSNLPSYFSNVTLITIDLGDITLTTHPRRSLFSPFTVGGIIIIGLVIGSIRNLILDFTPEERR
jgi:hypothetical protein